MAPAASPMLAALHEVTDKLEIALRRLTAEEFAARFPYMNNRQQHICEIEETKAGYISPRKLVEAEQKAAIQNGCRLIRDVADKVREVQVDGGQTTVLEVTTAGGHVIHADKVLLSTGSYTGFRSLVGDVTLPSLYLHKQTVTLAEIGEDDAERLR
jgi:sarcosine oxidase